MRVFVATLIGLLLLAASQASAQGYLVFSGDPDFDRRVDEGVPDWRTRPMPRPAEALDGIFAADPVGILRMVRLGAATSTCIGRPVTALCAVETDVACYARFDAALCKVAWIDFDEDGYFPKFAPPPGDVYLYRVADVRPIGTGFPVPGPWARDGDVVIDILWMDCRDGRDWCGGTTVPASYAVRQLGANRWGIVWASRPFYIDSRDPDVLAAIKNVKADPDFFAINIGLVVPRPDWRRRSPPRDARTLDGVFLADPIGTLRMSGVDEATSLCIGSTVTAACAVETAIACLVRLDESLCRVAWQDSPYCIDGRTPRAGVFELYRFTDVRVADPDPKMPDVRRGDLLIDVVVMKCAGDDRHCFSYVVPFTYAVRRDAAGAWRIVDIYAPRF